MVVREPVPALMSRLSALERQAETDRLARLRLAAEGWVETRHTTDECSECGLKKKRAECGTRSGYRRHRNDGEEACGPCLEAHRLATSEYRRRTGRVKQPRAVP